MNNPAMTSMQRVLTALSHKEPDRVPLFLLLYMQGAKELGLSIREYFSNSENVVEGQLRLHEKYNSDCVSNFLYAGVEIEAWGGDIVFVDDGPPNTGAPLIRRKEEIKNLFPPSVKNSPSLQKVLKITELLKKKVGDSVPILGVVISPFSLPVMQLGFENYLDVIYEHPGFFEHLMKTNEAFCVEWGNAQLSAGATAIAYFDPLSSPSITPRAIAIETGLKIAKRIFTRLKGPAAIHFASERCLSISPYISETGALAVGVSAEEDIAELKKAFAGKTSIIGNLNGVEMRRWTPDKAEKTVKDIIAKAGKGGGFILSDNHGEIPWQIPEDIIHAISNGVEKWGKYPLNWIAEYE